MSNRISVQVDRRDMARLLATAPGALERILGAAVQRGGREVARAARDKAPKAFTTLTQSVQQFPQQDPLETVVGATANYAPFVEYGTGRFGPGAAAGGRMPPLQALVDWVRVKRITPDEPWMDEEDLAYVIGRSIAARGTPRQPFLKPAMRELSPRVRRLVYEALQRAIAEAAR